MTTLRALLARLLLPLACRVGRAIDMTDEQADQWRDDT